MKINILDAFDDKKISAEIIFENEKKSFDVWYESDSVHSLNGSAADVFLTASFLPAWIAGEKNISVSQPVDPLLVANLTVIANKLSQWYEHLKLPAPKISAEISSKLSQGKHSAVFLSGGVDSTASLIELTDLYNEQNIRRPKYGVLVDYQAIGGISDTETEDRYQSRKELCTQLAKDRGVELIPIRTNIRCLNQSMHTWMYEWHGAVLSSVAHALGSIINFAHIASTYDYTTLQPWGSHPELDVYYSKRDVQINHHGLEHSRLDKVKLISDWELALNTINVCVSSNSKGRNCGKCEKCIRTRLELLVCNSLEKAQSFEGKNVDVTEVLYTTIGSDYAVQCYKDVIPALLDMGRKDLVDVINFSVFLSESIPHFKIQKLQMVSKLTKDILRKTYKLKKGLN